MNNYEIEIRLNPQLETIIPTTFLEKYNLEEGDIIEWNENENGEITIKFRKLNL